MRKQKLLYLLSDKITDLRLKRKLNQHELAKLADVHAVSINFLENKKGFVSVPTLKKLANALNVSIDYLLNEEDNSIAKNYSTRYNKKVQKLLEVYNNLSTKDQNELLEFSQFLTHKNELVYSKV